MSGAGGRVTVLGLGGTIAMTVPPGGGGAVPALSAAELVAALPGLAASGITVDTASLRQRPGGSLTFDDYADVAQAAQTQLAGGADGVVITQGTNTIEETAYLLDLTHTGSAPIVVTGAMRNPSLAGADGPANLLAAVQTAASPQARNQGVLVVFADEIHAARYVRKTHATSPATFRSLDAGPLGHVVEGRPTLLARLPHRTVVPDGSGSPRVGLWTVTFGDDGALLPAVAAGCDGLVVAGFGVGHVPESILAPLTEIAGRIPVVLASRTGSGPVLAGTYAFPGSESDLLARGLIRAGFLDPLKARVLLRTVLRVTTDRATLAAAFGAAGGYADPSDWPW